MKQKIILTGGKFNKIHPGHLWLLKKAKKLGYLIVVLANDAHNKRPYAKPAKIRKKMVGELGIADKIVVGDPDKFVGVLRRFRPSIIVLGYDQSLPDRATEEWVKAHKTKVVRFKKYGMHSSRES